MSGKQRLTDKARTDRVMRKAAYQKQWHKDNREKVRGYKRWHTTHPVEHGVNAKRWREENPARAKETKQRYYRANAEKLKAMSTAWRTKHPLQYKEYYKKWRNETQVKQAGRKRPKRCELCKKSDKKLCFDHCHKSQKFRGWLCHTCNAALGFANDSPKLLRKMADYLEAFNVERKKK